MDSVLLTSANAARHAGPAAGGFLDFPCYAVGEATAEAAKQAGFTSLRIGHSDGTTLVDMAAAEGARRALHLCGRDHIALSHPQLTLIRRIVYAAEPVPQLPQEATDALKEGAIALLHSPRAAATFADLVDAAGLNRSSIRIVAISPAALASAGVGWRSAESAAVPRDEALLELAAKLCQT